MRFVQSRDRRTIPESVKESIVNSKTLHRAALELPPDERAELAQKLLLSLDDLSDKELSQTWLTEAERRARELDCGEVRPVAAEEVRRKARALLR